MRDTSRLLRNSLDSLNLSLYFDKYSPIILFPEIIKRINKKVVSPTGGLIRLSVNFLYPKILERAEREKGRNNLIGFLSNFLDSNDRMKPKFTVNLPKAAFECYRGFYKDYKDMLRSLNAESREFKTKSRLVVGLGDESIYETSIRLLRNYGVPYIPGSALKGITKHWSIYMLTELLQVQEDYRNTDFYKLAKKVQNSLEAGDLKIFPDENVYPKDELQKEFLEAFENRELTLRKIVETLVNIFGTTEKQGTVIFFDALPTLENVEKKPILELDIMNPHYQPYYQGNEAPGDWHNPVPIFFLTVPKGIGFLVALAPRKGSEDLTEIAMKLLTQALREYGVGAKTALGYGRLGYVGRWRESKREK